MHSRSDAPSSNPTHCILNCFFSLKNWRHFDFYEHFIKKFHIRQVKCLVRGGCQFGRWNQVTTCYFTCCPMIDILGSFCLGKPVPYLPEAPLCLNPSAENHPTLLCLTSYSWWDPMELNTWFCQEQVDFFPFWVFPRWPLKSRKSMLLKCTT